MLDRFSVHRLPPGWIGSGLGSEKTSAFSNQDARAPSTDGSRNRFQHPFMGGRKDLIVTEGQEGVRPGSD